MKEVEEVYTITGTGLVAAAAAADGRTGLG